MCITTIGVAAHNLCNLHGVSCDSVVKVLAWAQGAWLRGGWWQACCAMYMLCWGEWMHVDHVTTTTEELFLSVWLKRFQEVYATARIQRCMRLERGQIQLKLVWGARRECRFCPVLLGWF